MKKVCTGSDWKLEKLFFFTPLYQPAINQLANVAGFMLKHLHLLAVLLRRHAEFALEYTMKIVRIFKPVPQRQLLDRFIGLLEILANMLQPRLLNIAAEGAARQ